MADLQIRRLTLADKPVADALLCRAFAGINPGGMVEREVALAPETCWLACLDGVAIGLVCAIQYDQISYIGPMAVSPDHQGKGIGRALLEWLIDGLERRGSTTMLLDATEAGEPLYRKFGFREIAHTFEMGRHAGLGITQLPGLGLFDQAARMDCDWFGANRERMLRRLLEDEGAALYHADGGYLISQTKVLGPFAALEPGIGAELLDRALAAGAVASRVLAPVENRAAERLLTSRGFQVQREVKHMRRGSLIELRRDLMYGLASFALG